MKQAVVSASALDALEFPFEVGVVRFVHPAVLTEHGAKVAGVEAARAVVGPHLFVIAAINAEQAVLAVVHSNAGFGRVLTPYAARSGHQAWLARTSHLSLHQLWFASRY